jgi:hypothetical protein
LRLLAVGAEGETLRLACEAPTLTIGGEIDESAPVDPSTARDIRDVVPLSRPTWPWFVAAGALLLLGLFLGYRRWIRRKRAALAPMPEIARLSPDEEFEQAIGRLLASGLLERGLYREFYYGVSSAVRLFLERIHGLPLLESSSDEVRALLEPVMTEPAPREALRAWLREGDLVKYARMERLQAEALKYLESSRRLLRLIPRPAASSEAEPTDGEPGSESELHEVRG